jgi:hypothetical protein
MEDEVFQFTAQYFGVKPEGLAAWTCPYPDLTLDDTRMEAFLWRFSQHFGVPFPALNNRHAWAYFVQSLPVLPELGTLFSTPAALWHRLAGVGSSQDADVISFSPWLTLSDLIQAATRAARHPESSGIPPHTAE